jgi:DNA-directed RNA polymerase subunit RPC12/RpoP
MSEIRVFFRHCPSCGRRFHIKLIEKKDVASETMTEKMTPLETEMQSGLIHPNPWVLPLTEGEPVIVDIEKFQYTYKCTHCGHQWSEFHEKEQSVKA